MGPFFDGAQKWNRVLRAAMVPSENMNESTSMASTPENPSVIETASGIIGMRSQLCMQQMFKGSRWLYESCLRRFPSRLWRVIWAAHHTCIQNSGAWFQDACFPNDDIWILGLFWPTANNDQRHELDQAIFHWILCYVGTQVIIIILVGVVQGAWAFLVEFHHYQTTTSNALVNRIVYRALPPGTKGKLPNGYRSNVDQK